MRWKKLVSLVATGAFSFAGACYAQDLTAEEKFRLLAEAGVFDGSGDTQFDENMTREQLAAVLASILDLDVDTGLGQGPTFQDLTGDEWYAGYIGAALQLGLPNGGVFNPDPALSEQQLALIMAGYLGSGSGANEPGAGGWGGLVPTQLDAALEPSQFIRDRLLEDLNASLPPGTGPNDAWSSYPFYAANQRTAVLPDEGSDFLNSSSHATYSGIARGALADGDPLVGTSFFDIGFHFGSAHLDGNFSFDSGEVVTFSGTQDGNQLFFNVSSGEFRDGMLTHGEGDGAFYGPQAEEFAGGWAFTIVDGTDPGVASGQFAAKR